jgi:hypothetical protein
MALSGRRSGRVNVDKNRKLEGLVQASISNIGEAVVDY